MNATTQARKAKKRSSAKGPVVREYQNKDVDYTPPSRLVHARGVQVVNGGFRVRVEEGLIGQQQVFNLGIFKRDSRGEDGYESLAWFDFAPDDMDNILEAMTIAIARAKKLGMPNLPTE